MYVSIIKPIVDRVGALVLLVPALPVVLLAAILLFLSNRGKVFFIQSRIGYRERKFKIIKLKTLRDVKGTEGNLLPDEDRTFPIGLLIRRLHIDELPQLLNVLLGDLSFVGPRPLLPEYLPYYSQYQKLRHDVKPGLTGLSQVMGGNALPWPQRLRLDAWYALHLSAGLDVRILAQTIRYMFSAKQGKSSHVFSEHFVEYVERKKKRHEE
jgi:lipopolysaccharide/colanic/teichoic acid biosynthesis glycosyltransferase